MIKLRAEFNVIPGCGVWHSSDKDDLYHDAAVAQALMQAIELLAAPERGYGQPTAEDYYNEASNVLRDTYGITE